MDATDRSGLDDLLDWLPEGGFAWMAVAAPAAMVTACLADAWGPRRVVERVEARDTDAVVPRGSGLVAVVQPEDSDWTFVFQAFGEVGVEHVLALSDRAADLSQSLEAEALVCYADALDGDAGYELWQEGRRMQRVAWQVDGPIHHFEAEGKAKPEGDTFGLDLPASLVDERGIRVPACCTRADDTGIWLEVVHPSADAIQRADILDITGRRVVEEERVQRAVERALAERDHDEHGSVLRGVIELVGRVFH